MKYIVILILIGIITIPSAGTVYGMWFPQSPEELFEQSETVFVGTVTSVNVLEFERSNTRHIEENGIPQIEIENYTQTLDEYTVDIEEFLKNPQESNTITMLEATVSGVPGRSVSIGGFELGDVVLFYVPKIDGTNQYSPESFKIPNQCDAKLVLNQPRIDGRNSFDMLQNGVIKRDNFTAGMPIDFVYERDLGSLDGESFDFQIAIRKETDPGKFDELVLSEKINAKSNTCEWIATAKAEFVPQVGNYQTWVHTEEGTSGSSFSGSFSVYDSVKYGKIIPPLKQIKSGISADEIQCKDEFVQVSKKSNNSPACVSLDTKTKLMQRGWAVKDSSTQKIIERLKQDTQPINEADARYIETLALMNQTVSNFVYGVEWTTHCCGYSENDGSYEITITFLDSDNKRQLGVTFDADTMQITDIQQSNAVNIGKGLSSEPDPYRLIALREFSEKPVYYHKINNISEIPYISKINENKTTIITSEQFDELLEWFPEKCLENNSDSHDCSNTPPTFEYDSAKYLIVSHGLDSNEVYCESDLLYITDYEQEFPDRKLEDFVPTKCITPSTKQHLIDK